MAPADSQSVAAHYTSPTGEKHDLSIPISAACTDKTTADRTKYLGELRTNTKQLQADINKFLTEKMEEDKKRAGDVQAKKDEELEEENYGEEQAEDED